MDADKWFKEDKHNSGLHFPNLPYLVDGEYTLTETEAIQRYICHRWGKKALLGRDIQETAKLDAILSIFN